MKEFTHQEMLDKMPEAKEMLHVAQLDVDKIYVDKGYIQFHDIVNVVSSFTDNAPLAEALKRLLECDNVVTVLASEYVSVR
jgi:hypothetical protein